MDTSHNNKSRQQQQQQHNMSGDRNWLYTDTFAGHTQYAVCDDDRDWGVSEGAGGKPFTDIHMTTTLAPSSLRPHPPVPQTLYRITHLLCPPSIHLGRLNARFAILYAVQLYHYIYSGPCSWSSALSSLILTILIITTLAGLPGCACAAMTQKEIQIGNLFKCVASLWPVARPGGAGEGTKNRE